MCVGKTSPESVRRTKSWLSDPPSGVGSCSAAPAPTTSFCWTCRLAAQASTTLCRSRERLGPRSSAPSCFRLWRSCDQELGGRARHRGLRHTPAAFSRVLWLRAVPRRRPDLCAEPDSSALCVPEGRFRGHRSESGKGAESRSDRGRGYGGPAQDFGGAALRQARRSSATEIAGETR